jgi:hypothetical protein
MHGAIDATHADMQTVVSERTACNVRVENLPLVSPAHASRGVGPPPDDLSAGSVHPPRHAAPAVQGAARQLARRRSRDVKSSMPCSHATAEAAPTALSKTGVVTQAWDGGDARRTRNDA